MAGLFRLLRLQMVQHKIIIWRNTQSPKTQIKLLCRYKITNVPYQKTQVKFIRVNPNESGKEAQKETMRLIDIGLPQSKNKVNSNSKARIESKIQ